ncbi:MAG: GTPase HflX [Pseudoclavibacter sp.]
MTQHHLERTLDRIERREHQHQDETRVSHPDHRVHPDRPHPEGEHSAEQLLTEAQALQTRGLADLGGAEEVAERAALQRVPGLSTELEDVTEVEYRRLRLERVVLIGIYADGDRQAAENSLAELAALAETAGSVVLDGLLQRRPNPDPGTFLGRGKADELHRIVAEAGADTVIADTELAPSQRRGLEDIVKVKVVDRTALILDIFAQHAKSREGKAQVELAQLQYLLPRLRGWGDTLSRQAGGRAASGEGIGSRGPGETKIETDRRYIHGRIARLRKQIKAMKPAREAKRANRHRHGVPAVAIAGYTNAGKSSLLNRLTGSDVLVENALFATLDATVRQAVTAQGRQYTFTDTVGFVADLPHQLLEAFRSTLEETADADVVVHVVDGSHPDPVAQIDTVRQVLRDIGAAGLPEIVVFNKCDLIDDETRLVLRGSEPRAVFVSARTGEGLDELRARVEAALPSPGERVDVVIPFDRGELVSQVHETGQILASTYTETGTHIQALVPEGLAAALRESAVA